MIAVKLFLGERSVFGVYFCILQCNVFCFFRRDEQCTFAFFKDNSKRCVDFIRPLRFTVVKDEVEVRGFDAAANVFLDGKHKFCKFVVHACVFCGYFFRLSDVDVIIEIEYLSGFGVDLDAVLKLFCIKFQNPARATLIATKLFLGENDFLFGSDVHVCKLQRNFFCFFQRNKEHYIAFFKDSTTRCVDAISPLDVSVVEHKTIIRGFNSAVDKNSLGESDSVDTARILQGDLFGAYDADKPCGQDFRIDVFLQINQLVQRELRQFVNRQPADFRRLFDKFCFALGHAVFLGYFGCFFAFLLVHVHHCLHRIGFFKGGLHVFCHRFLEFLITVQLFVERN